MHWRCLLGTCQSCVSRDVCLIERGNPAGRTAAQPIAQEPEDIIDSYTDAQALEDGVLVAWDTPPVNRVTRSVFDHFTHPMGNSPLSRVVLLDITTLRRVVHTMLAVEADADGWRVGAYEGMLLWLVPNEVSGLTLMFPEDY
jgi:hypothetical protein